MNYTESPSFTAYCQAKQIRKLYQTLLKHQIQQFTNILAYKKQYYQCVGQVLENYEDEIEVDSQMLKCKDTFDKVKNVIEGVNVKAKLKMRRCRNRKFQWIDAVKRIQKYEEDEERRMKEEAEVQCLLTAYKHYQFKYPKVLVQYNH